MLPWPKQIVRPFDRSEMLDAERVNRFIETLCARGCNAVRDTITALESGAAPGITGELNDEEREAVLRELKAIMAVYDR